MEIWHTLEQILHLDLKAKKKTEFIKFIKLIDNGDNFRLDSEPRVQI